MATKEEILEKVQLELDAFESYMQRKMYVCLFVHGKPIRT